MDLQVSLATLLLPLSVILRPAGRHFVELAGRVDNHRVAHTCRGGGERKPCFSYDSSRPLRPLGRSPQISCATKKASLNTYTSTEIAGSGPTPTTFVC